MPRHKRATSPLQVLDVKNPGRSAAALAERAHDRRVALRCLPGVLRRAAGAPRRCGHDDVLDPTLVRGLSYYADDVGDRGPEENLNSTICGGGRYDGLIEAIGGPSTPGIGFGAGLEQLCLAVDGRGPFTYPPNRHVISRSTAATAGRCSLQ